jgi:hypothetical protein
MAVRIQLASNFQVIELTYDSWADVNTEELDDATNLVNQLGSKVKNEIKTTKPQTQEKMASEKQINFACKLGLSREKAEKMTSKEIWKWLQENK